MNKLCMGMVASLLAGATFAAAPASACEFRVEGDNALWNAGRYNPFVRDNVFEERFLSVENTTNQDCNLTVSVTSPGLSRNVMKASDSTDSLRYSLYERSTGTPISADSGRGAGGFSSFSVPLRPFEKRQLRFGLNIPAGQLVEAANYSQALAFDFEDRRTGERSTVNMGVEATVPPLASISLAGQVGARGRRAGFVNLGELTTGKRVTDRTVAIRTVGTSPYRVNVESENNGYLVRDGRNDDWKIDYMLFLDENPMFDTGGTGELRFNESAQTRLISVAFQIGEADSVRAGTYSDVITISIAPL